VQQGGRFLIRSHARHFTIFFSCIHSACTNKDAYTHTHTHTHIHTYTYTHTYIHPSLIRSRFSIPQTYIKDINRLKGNCGFIEISRGGRLERVFFQIPSVCRYLTRHAKDNILAKVNRDNHQDQMGDFVERGQIRYEEMLHFQELHTSMLYSAFSRWSDKLDIVFFLNALAINIIILFAYKYYDNQYKTLLDMANIIIDTTSSQ